MNNELGWVSSWELMDNYFIIEKDGKFGLVNNNGLVVVDLIQEYYFSLLNGQEFYWYCKELDEVPFTTFRFGGGHGIGGSHIYFDTSLNHAMVVRYGDDGPGSYYDFEPYFGVTDFSGATLVPFEYEWISPYYNNAIILKKNGAWTTRIVNE